MTFAITDILIWLFKFAVKSCTSPNSKKAFSKPVSETTLGKNIVTKTALVKFFLRSSFPPRGGSGRIP